MSVQRIKYDPDFKRHAIRLTEDPDRTVKEIAANLRHIQSLSLTNQ
jgi:transposase-like protein